VHAAIGKDLDGDAPLSDQRLEDAAVHHLGRAEDKLRLVGLDELLLDNGDDVVDLAISLEHDGNGRDVDVGSDKVLGLHVVHERIVRQLGHLLVKDLSLGQHLMKKRIKIYRNESFL